MHHSHEGKGTAPPILFSCHARSHQWRRSSYGTTEQPSLHTISGCALRQENRSKVKFLALSSSMILVYPKHLFLLQTLQLKVRYENKPASEYTLQTSLNFVLPSWLRAVGVSGLPLTSIDERSRFGLPVLNLWSLGRWSDDEYPLLLSSTGQRAPLEQIVSLTPDKIWLT